MPQIKSLACLVSRKTRNRYLNRLCTKNHLLVIFWYTVTVMRLIVYITSKIAHYRRQKIERDFCSADKEQDRVFRHLMCLFDGNTFAQTHLIKKSTTYSEFQENVPVSTYEEFFPYIKKMLLGEPRVVKKQTITIFAKSSGTTNARSKYIPITRSNLKRNHYQAGRDMIVWAVDEYKNTSFLGGKMLGTTGSFSFDPEFPKAKIGDVSAHLFHSLPWYARLTRPAKVDVFLKDNWHDKINQIVTCSQNEDIRILLGTPTWMLQILDHTLLQTNKKTIQEVWPKLSIFFHGAVQFAPYKKRFQEKIGTEIDCMNIYNASEGFIGFQYKKTNPDEFVLLTSHDIFYECILLADFRNGGRNASLLSTVEIGKEYVLILTTSGGLVRYILGDTVSFVSKNPYIFRLTGRTKQSLNTFGEEIILENIERAINRASEETVAQVAHFTVTSAVTHSIGYHDWAIEFYQEPKNLEDFVSIIDATLQEINSDYQAKRFDDMILGKPRLTVVKKGTFEKQIVVFSVIKSLTLHIINLGIKNTPITKKK